MTGRAGLFTSLKHRDFRLMMAAFTASAIGSWAYNVALTVWIFQQTGSAGWVGAATIGRFIPALFFSAYGGVIAERFERVRLMVILDLGSFLVMVGLTWETALGAPVFLAIVTAAVTSTIGSAYEPAVVAMTPQLVGERDLGSANSLRNTVDNVSVIAGPGLGALLLFLGPPPLAIAINAASYLFSAILLTRIKATSTPVDVTEGGEVGAFVQMMVGAKAIATTPSAFVLVNYSVVATFVFGVDTVMFVVLSRDALGTGAEGYGYLLAGLGAGGVLAAGIVTRLERLPKLGTVILMGMAVYCLPTLIFLVVGDPVIAFIVEGVRGAGTRVVDVLAMTALQRVLPRDMLARVVGAFNAFMLLAIVAGAFITPLVLGWFGLKWTLWVMGLGLPVVCLAGWPALKHMDQEAAARRAGLAPRLALLIGCELFDSVSEGGTDQLAGSAMELSVEAGQQIVREGELADAFYVIVEGVIGVSARGECGEIVRLNDLEPGDYFGEIGLIERVPRTATVTAKTAAKLLRVDGAAFVDALTETTPSAALLDGAYLRLRRTHPSLAFTGAGIAATDGDSGDTPS